MIFTNTEVPYEFRAPPGLVTSWVVNASVNFLIPALNTSWLTISTPGAPVSSTTINFKPFMP